MGIKIYVTVGYKHFYILRLNTSKQSTVRNETMVQNFEIISYEFEVGYVNNYGYSQK
jgi:hypothetical protein